MSHASGKYAYFICDTCGFRYDYQKAKTTWANFRVCSECYEPKHPQREPASITVDAESLWKPRPDVSLPQSQLGVIITTNAGSGMTFASDPIGTDFKGFEGTSAIGNVIVGGLMAGFTYTELKTAVQNYLDNTETTFVNTLNTFIQTTEERILKAAELPVFRKNVKGSATADVEYLQTPDDFLSPYSLAVIDASNNYTYLLLKHVSWIRDYTPARATTGQPLYYALFDNDTFIMAPTPPSALSFELHYNYRPASLTTVGGDNKSWLSENAPNAMLYGALVEGALFMKIAPETLMLYEQKFQEALAMLKLLGEFKDVRDEARHDQIKIMPQGTANV